MDVYKSLWLLGVNNSHSCGPQREMTIPGNCFINHYRYEGLEENLSGDTLRVFDMFIVVL